MSEGQTGYVDEAFAYTGRLLDRNTGLQNNLNRWYDASTGRWLSEDPIGFAAGDANLYRYVGNGPVNGTDPRGLIYGMPWQWEWAETGDSPEIIKDIERPIKEIEDMIEPHIVDFCEAVDKTLDAIPLVDDIWKDIKKFPRRFWDALDEWEDIWGTDDDEDEIGF